MQGTGTVIPAGRDGNGRRYAGAEIEVPGSPEQVWRAVATGPGMSSWFVPTKIEERAGGKAVSSFGPGMDAVAEITNWDPPRTYTAEAGDGTGRIATEWLVEPGRNGTCVVRVMHRWDAAGEEWDAQFETQAYGWACSFFRILRLHLAHFPGQQCSAFDLAAFSAAPPHETWRIVKGALAIDERERRAVAAPGAPDLAGAVEIAEITDPELLRIRKTAPQIAAALADMGGEEPELLIRLDRPAPGLVHLFVMPMGDRTMVSIRFFFYGDRGAEAAPEARRQWSDWLAGRFPG